MSEYQYYEFQAIDRPLDKQAMAKLRAITSRAEITPTSLINEYHWGDFKGDPKRLMEQYFDAFLYMANWGSRRLMLRLPRASFSKAEVQPYLGFDSLNASTTKTHVILDFQSEDEGGEDFYGADGWLGSLIPLRSELLAHDLRSLYLGWLAGTQHEEEEEDHEPVRVPAGMRSLSGTLRRLVDFLRIDRDVLKTAVKASPDLPAKTTGRADVAVEPTARAPHFTYRQGQFLAFIKWYSRLNRRSPAEADFVRYFRLTPPSVHSMIVKLSDLGLINRSPGVARSLRLAIGENEVPELEEIDVKGS